MRTLCGKRAASHSSEDLDRELYDLMTFDKHESLCECACQMQSYTILRERRGSAELQQLLPEDMYLRLEAVVLEVRGGRGITQR